MIIEDIKRYLTKGMEKELKIIINDIYKKTEFLNDTYPGYKNWFFEKQIKGCYTPSRNIIFVRDENKNIIGFSCLKKDKEESKICTLFVDLKYRRQGIGNILLEESMKFLDTTKPLATFTEDKMDMFYKIVEKYNWELTEIIDGIYNEGVREYCFNGQLSKRNYRQELIDVLKKVKEIANKELEPTDKLNKISKK